MGMKLSQYGLFNVKTGKKLAGTTETGIFRKLGKTYKTPEEREARFGMARIKTFLSLENAFKELEAHAKEIKNEIKTLEKKGYTNKQINLVLTKYGFATQRTRF